MLVLFASAFLLGLIFDAVPGAVFAGTVRQGVRGGFRFALAVQLASPARACVCAALRARVLRLTADRWARLTYRACASAFLPLAPSSLRELRGRWPQRTQLAAALEQRNGD